MSLLLESTPAVLVSATLLVVAPALAWSPADDEDAAPSGDVITREDGEAPGEAKLAAKMKYPPSPAGVTTSGVPGGMPRLAGESWFAMMTGTVVGFDPAGENGNTARICPIGVPGARCPNGLLPGSALVALAGWLVVCALVLAPPGCCPCNGEKRGQGTVLMLMPCGVGGI